MARSSILLSVFAVFCVLALASAEVQQAATAAPARKLLQGWPEPPINVRTSAGPLTIRRYPWSVQNIVGLNVALPNPILRGRGSH
ncbi:hypothetical protein MNEG_8458 [Monoraphidium neglectum]|uniref:Uncharacterized protein n=1 Tax=Monoraphidium neglectum TaxID=145388 RepID=A0A0D2MZE7_9CHLO|nr:hypothetical protein MNEG_8458 [Monoraphidium neglectum]KIY99505.1 hypothetical protein MNEG_8458 [Monoraphidium neglectum]|eukprot:XP_013898525.1 hypothetical protein MNEG_8458 [Monoraphidium neglectum]